MVAQANIEPFLPKISPTITIVTRMNPKQQSPSSEKEELFESNNYKNNNNNNNNETDDTILPPGEILSEEILLLIFSYLNTQSLVRITSIYIVLFCWHLNYTIGIIIITKMTQF